VKPEHKEEMKKRARNICLRVAYDGTDYCGFQRQKPPGRAVQNVLEEALEKIFGDSIELAAAGRTDAGVHALGQVVNFFTDGKIPLAKIPVAVNAVLPKDIVITHAFEADFSFSARHSAISKTYVYRVYRGERGNDGGVSLPSPFKGRFAWYVPRELNFCAMEEALALIRGEHDFSSFRASPKGSVNRRAAALIGSVRTIYRAELNFSPQDDLLTFTFHGSGFLYHMVRNIVGTVIDVGKGKLTTEDFRRIFQARDRNLASPTAPPQGLFLVAVEYADKKNNFESVNIAL